jgi:hypothetical protein
MGARRGPRECRVGASRYGARFTCVELPVSDAREPRCSRATATASIVRASSDCPKPIGFVSLKTPN